MFRDVLIAFLDGAIAGLVFSFIGNILNSYLPGLPSFISSAIVIGVLVLIVDLILREAIKF